MRLTRQIYCLVALVAVAVTLGRRRRTPAERAKDLRWH